MTMRMNPLKENRPGEIDEHAGTDKGNTTRQQGGAQVPRLPHEHDQSADQQAGADRPSAERTQMAFDDIERGVIDTDRRSAYYEDQRIPGRQDRRRADRRQQPQP